MKNNGKQPDDFKDEEDFMSHIRSQYSLDAEADKENRVEELEDHRFVAGKQWDQTVYDKRIANNKPALVFNRLPAFVSQVVGNRRLNETVIKVIPEHDKDKPAAKVREEIVRNIQRNSVAKRAYDAAFQNQVIGGQGNFEIVLDYESDDVFEQEIQIQPIHNPQSVVWPRLSYDPTGRDAPHVFVTERIDRDDFEERWPDASASNFCGDETTNTQLTVDGWVDQNTVRIANYWRMRTRKRTLAMFLDGTTKDVTDMDVEEYADQIATREDGSPIIREVNKKYAEGYLVSGAEILEGPYELPISRVPVFRAAGWEVNVGDLRVRFGLIRFLRDSSRLHNYWRSVLTEKLMMAPKATWLAGKTSVKGYEQKYRNSHRSEDNLLIYDNEEGQEPRQVQPPQVDTALIQEAGMAAQDIKDITNLHEASLGQTSNEVSGKAIMARQRVGETGTVIYQDNMNMAIEEAGKVINELIPYVYDTPRVLKITGATDEEEVKFIRINYPGDSNSVDITEGKYSIITTTGPSYATKRIEAAESMMAAVNAMPESFAPVADLIAESQDWPGADKMAKRIRASMPANVLGEDLSPEQQQAQQQQAQVQKAQLDLQMEEVKAKIEEMKARAEKARAEARRAAADTEETLASIDRDDVVADANIQSQERRDALQTIDAIKGENNV